MKRSRLCILSRKRSLYSTRRLVEATRKLGAQALVIDTLRCTTVVSTDRSRLLYRGAEVKDVTAVIPRIGASITSYGMAVVNQFDIMGVAVVNTAPSIARSRDKMRCLQLLAQSGISIPKTVMAAVGSSVKSLIEEVGGLPCIIKLLRGTQGVGVMIANTVTEAQTILQTFWGLDQDVCLQEFIRESEGRDVRALIIGDRIIAAMRRQAREGEFRSNIHRGGTGAPLQLESAYEAAAVKAAKVIGLGICGVDMLEGQNGPIVIELNSSPGFEGLERTTNIDIAAKMAEFALSLVKERKAT